VRALVSGATGFVGAAVARALLRDGWQVRALARAGSDRSNLEGLPLEIAVGDLNEPASLEPAVADCRALFHVAADYRLGARDPEQLYRTNVEGTRNILTAARRAGVERSIYTSSVATMGIPPDGIPGDEATPVALEAMIGHYKRSKFLAERAVLDEARAGLPVVIVNPSTPVGPGDVKPTPTGQLVLDAACGRMPAYVDTGLNIVHVERYILGGKDMSLREILAEISRLVGRDPPRVRLPYAAVLPIAYVAEAFSRVSGRAGRVTLEGVRMSRKRMFFSSAKAQRELGYTWRPPVEAFADAVKWFRGRGLLPDR
jgi:dihydroflavonol-4-reductase